MGKWRKKRIEIDVSIKDKESRTEYYRQYNRKRRKLFIEEIRLKDKLWQRKNRNRYPEKTKARNRLNWLIYSGKITKPKKCEKCKKRKRLTGHHEDYSKPLVVKWLCYKCHRDLHHPHLKMLSTF